MLFRHKYRNNSKDGIVVVSISNLFHLLDLSRKQTEEDSNIFKPSTYTFSSSESKEKEIYKPTKSIITEMDSETKQNEKEIKAEESKEFIIEKRDEIKDFRDNNNIRTGNLRRTQTNKFKKATMRQPTKKKKHKICDYFVNLTLCNFLLLIFNNCIFWIFCYMASEQKNRSYCYNHHLREFEICVRNDFCPSYGIHDFLYVNDDNLSDKDLKKEINNINNKFSIFYNYESKLFSNFNKKFIKIENTLSKYDITIILTKNENYLFNNTFRVGCETYLIGILIILLITTTIGTFIFGLLADIFGRKKIIIFSNICQIIGGISLFITTSVIKKYDKEEIFKKEIKEQINNFTEFYYGKSFLNAYINNFIDIKGEVLKTQVINDNFKNLNIFILGSIFLIFLSNSSTKIVTLAYLLENALTDESMSLYFLFFNLSQPISIILTTIMVIYLDSFEYPILICSIIIFIITLLIIIFFFESQRYNFEYCYYTKITEFTEYILGKEELKKNYRVKEEEKKKNIESILAEKEDINYFGILYSTEDYRIQSELNNEKINQNTFISDAFKFSRQNFYNELYSNKKINRFKPKNIIERIIILKDPFYIIKLLFKERHIQKNLYIIIAFIINLSIVINLPLQRITSHYLLKRDDLISSKVFINYLFLILLLMIIILFPFVHYLIKCFGIYSVLFPFLVLITIGTWFFELSCFLFWNGGMVDLTKYDDRSEDQIIDKWNQNLLPQLFLNSISLICLDYVLYFVIIKLTKTIYRCSALAISQILHDLCFILGMGLENFIKGGNYYSGIFSLISLINSFFINSSDDSLNISEVREIQYDENENKNK